MVTFFDAKFDKSLIVVPREAGVSIGLDYYTTQSRALVENIHLAPKVLIAIRLLNLFIQLVYLYFHNFTAIFPFKNTSFFKLVNIFCITLAIRSLYWILLVIVAGQLDITLLFALGLDISLYLDIAGDQFGHCMMFLLAFNRLTSMKMIRLHFPRYDVWNGKKLTWSYFRNNWELLFVVSVVVALTVGSTLLYIEYSDTRRNFVREIGFIDLAQQKGYNLVSCWSSLSSYDSICSSSTASTTSSQSGPPSATSTSSAMSDRNARAGFIQSQYPMLKSPREMFSANLL